MFIFIIFFIQKEEKVTKTMFSTVIYWSSNTGYCHIWTFLNMNIPENHKTEHTHIHMQKHRSTQHSKTVRDGCHLLLMLMCGLTILKILALLHGERTSLDNLFSFQLSNSVAHRHRQKRERKRKRKKRFSPRNWTNLVDERRKNFQSGKVTQL